MFLKRSLVMMVGVLLFIGALLLQFHLSESHLENTFKNERVQYGVQDSELTLPEAAPPAPIIARAVVTPAVAPAATPSGSDSDSTAAPGNTTDPNMLIGPAAPNATPAPSSTPDTNAAPTSTPDTNSGPMMPAPSTMTRPYASPHLAMRGLAGLASRLLFAQTNTNSPMAGMTLRTEDTAPAPAKAEIVDTNSVRTVPSATTKEPAPVALKAAPASSEMSGGEHAGGRAIILGWHQFTGPGVPSRNIYSISQDVFESEMKYIHDNGYNVVPLSDVVAFVEGKKKLPPNAIALTIDDGYKSALNYGAPVLKKYGYPWTYFVYPAFITRTEGKGAASWPDLVELDREGVDVECHSMTHPILNRKYQSFGSRRPHMLTDAEYDQFLDSETVTAKAILEKELNKKIKYFAYPYGEYNSRVEEKVRAAGFEAIFTVAGNPVHITTPVYRMGRYIITKPVEKEFAAYLHQGALGIVQANPAPGAVITNPRPVITAVLDFHGDPASLETQVLDFGTVRHDFDPETSTLRLYLPRPLVQPSVSVSILQKDAASGQTRVANWQFNYEPAGGVPTIHPAIGTGPAPVPTPASATKSSSKASVEAPVPVTNAVPVPAPAAATNPAPVNP